MRRVTALIFIFLLLLALPVTASAADDDYATVITGAIPGQHTITINPGPNVSVILDGEPVSGTLVIDRHEDLDLAIIPDPGYVIDKVYVDGEDVTDQVVNGFLTLEKVWKDHDVQITVKQAPEASGRRFVLNGFARWTDGAPVGGAQVYLGSTGASDTTSYDLGQFSLRNIRLGQNSLTIIRDGKVLGHVAFTVQEGRYNGVSQAADGSYIVTVGRNQTSFRLLLLLDGSGRIHLQLGIDYDSVQGAQNGIPRTGDYIMAAVALLLISGGILALLLKKKDRFLKDKDPKDPPASPGEGS